MTAATVPERIRKRLRDWNEHGHPPVTIWNRDGSHRYVIGRRVISPHLLFDPCQLTVGVTWKAPWWGADYEDPGIVASVRVPWLCLCMFIDPLTEVSDAWGELA